MKEPLLAINSHSDVSPITSLNLYTWVKDTNFRFVNVSENLAELAGEDSAKSMAGKDDFSLIWKQGASCFRTNDIKIIKQELKFINQIETIKTLKDEKTVFQSILITKIPIFNKKGVCIGIAGSHINIPPHLCQSNLSNNFDNKGRLWLPYPLSTEYLTRQEVKVLKLTITGKTSKQIAQFLEISPRTVEGHVESLKRKLQCSYKNEIHIVATELGICHLL